MPKEGKGKAKKDKSLKVDNLAANLAEMNISNSKL